MPSSTLSVLIPLFNEEEFIGTLLERVIAAPLPAGMNKEIIVVDDGSTDESATIVAGFCDTYPGIVRLIRADRNRGKGAAIRTAVEHATGEYSVIQDADLEYNPAEYIELLTPLVDGLADVVFGSRFVNAGRRRVLYYWHSVANHILTTLCNLVADLNLTDMETGYKAFRTSLIKTIPIRCNRFGIEPELTIKAARRRARIYEVPVSYEGRTYEDGKKIGLKDAFAAILVIARFSLIGDLYKDRGSEILDSFASAPRFNRWMADTIRPFLGERVLEIGAGVGNLTRQLARRCKRYVATDIDTEHLVRLRNGLLHRPILETARCDLANAGDFLPFAGSMDTVVCLNVLEHLADDAGGLRNIHGALRAGGSAIILVPCGPELFGRMDVVLGHFRRYRKEQLRKRLEETGFRVEKILDFNRVSRPAWLLNSRLLKRSTIGRLQLKVFDRFVWLWRRIDHLLPWGPTSIIAIARKPDPSN